MTGLPIMALSATLICLGLVVLFFSSFLFNRKLGRRGYLKLGLLPCIDNICLFRGTSGNYNVLHPQPCGTMTELRTGRRLHWNEDTAQQLYGEANLALRVRQRETTRKIAMRK